jgi:hypothetical protein
MKSFLPFGAVSATPAIVNSRRLLALGASVLIAACASKPVTETTDTGTASAQQLVSADLDVVCKDVMITGSHFPKRVCRTKKEWGQIEDAGKSFAQGLQADGTRNLAPVSSGGSSGINPTPIGGAPVY